MPMSEDDRDRAARILGRRIYKGITANLGTDDLRAAVVAVDDGLETIVSTFQQTDTVEVALNKLLPDPFKITATQAQKGEALGITAGVKYGSI